MYACMLAPYRTLRMQGDWTSYVLSKLITGWLPSLLLTLWSGLVLPLVCYLLLQVDQIFVSAIEMCQDCIVDIQMHAALLPRRT